MPVTWGTRASKLLLKKGLKANIERFILTVHGIAEYVFMKGYEPGLEDCGLYSTVSDDTIARVRSNISKSKFIHGNLAILSSL